MSGNGINGSAAETGGGRASVARNGRGGSGRSGFNHGRDVVVNGNRKARIKAQSVQPLELPQEKLGPEQTALLAKKQVQLESIVDKHDDLVRELFHMENFTMMLSFDPAEAKMEQSTIFRDYKSKFDLIDKAAPAAGPSRQTRGRLNERRQIVTSAAISAPGSSSTVKRKPKPKPNKISELLENLPSYKGKGKEKEAIAVPNPATPIRKVAIQDPIESIAENLPSIVVVRRKPERPFCTPISTSVSVEPTTELAIESTTEPLELPPVPANVEKTTPPRSPLDRPRKTNRRIRQSALERPPSDVMDVGIARPLTESSKYGVIGFAAHPSDPLDESISVGLMRRSGRLKDPPKTSKVKFHFPSPDKVLLSEAPIFPSDISPVSLPPPTPSPIKFGIKRVRLIVRRPPPRLTNPRQRPPEPKFNCSLGNFLSSYVSVDEDDTTAPALDEQAKAEAEIREQVAQFRREGRFIPGTDVLFGTSVQDITHNSNVRVSKDIWDEVVDAVVARGRTRPRKSIGRQIASQISSKVQAHFDGQESKRVKAKEAEERRLRNLAKSTMKLVIAEWKKAVYHIREKERLEHEAEERRLGHAHLDAILDQSGQLLETQQGDLTRGDIYGSRSRSGSVGDFDNQDEEEDEEEGQEDEEQEEEDREEQQGEDDQDEADDEDDEDEDNIEGAGTYALITGPLTLDEDDEDSSVVGDLTVQTLALATRLSRTPNSTGSEHPQEHPESSIQLLNGDSAYQDFDMQSDTSFDVMLGDLAIPDPETSPQPPSKTQDFPNGGESNDSASMKSGSPTVLPEDIEILAKDLLQVEYDSESDSSEVEDSPENFAESQQRRWSEAVDDQDADMDQVVLADLADLPMAEAHEQEEKDADSEVEDEDEEETQEVDAESQIPEYLKPYAVTAVEWDPESQVTPPLLLRGVLRPYQQSGLEWLASLHVNRLNGILADEMGLGKTIQTIALLAHLACDRGIWGPHLIVVPTSVLLNWEMEFKKFLPGFRVLSYHGTTKRRKELRQGWNDKHHFNVCITSYTLASKDAHIFKRKAWYYMILDEAHMIKNFKSQRWNILLMFRSYRRLLLTGTPLQNNLTELWALLQFLMSGSNFANLKEFGEWFSNPLEKAIEMGSVLDDETMQRVSKLHTVLRPYLLRRLKRDVEKELPSKFEHLTLCPLSKRQRFLYDEFMSRAQTKDALDSGVYQKIANILMQLRKVCNHPDLFEVRPIVTSFAMPRSAIADFEIKELLLRRRFLLEEEESINLEVIGLRFVDTTTASFSATGMTRNLDGTTSLPYYGETAGEPPPKDTRTMAGFRKYSEYAQRASIIARWAHVGYLNKLRCQRKPVLPEDMLAAFGSLCKPILPSSHVDPRVNYFDNVYLVNQAVKSYATRAEEMENLVDRFAFVTPPVVALDLPRIALSGYQDEILSQPLDFDAVMHHASVKLQIAFPDPSLLQYDCGKLQELATLLREKKAGGHRILIFTQMTRILDILEIFLNFHGYLYLRLDGATKIEDRQYITERFNADPRIFCFIASSRSGGVGINLTGADTVIFYDSDFNPQMDRQCEDRAHRIGQIRDVHIYRFVSQYTVEEAMLLKANQKRSLDDLVIQKGEFDWRSLFNDEGALTKALGDFEDAEDRLAAAVAAREEFSLVGADEADFGGGDAEGGPNAPGLSTPADVEMGQGADEDFGDTGGEGAGADDEDEEQSGAVVDYMLAFVEEDYEFFRDWRM
ncbi:hypothetical protein GALMADRAFT_247988 [Galerina marginata CBS 339.88]|uniref:Helicase SWR1 n=1 Tax=Galerina marginata (strain CBS 339.88) TaxID=685588 RepID=A0A067T972_GALM3|nr:hypothetical protein GALMADRAFT_247988 [Galerina marginata CBS 339.88]